VVAKEKRNAIGSGARKTYVQLIYHCSYFYGTATICITFFFRYHSDILCDCNSAKRRLLSSETDVKYLKILDKTLKEKNPGFRILLFPIFFQATL
jgi:hypothetical protein